jgi:hypothetical protein
MIIVAARHDRGRGRGRGRRGRRGRGPTARPGPSAPPSNITGRDRWSAAHAVTGTFAICTVSCFKGIVEPPPLFFLSFLEGRSVSI